ncbi:hypothetical protein GCM10020220_064680 [Nonomuraea rubra]|uniref:hypothetical protein n=1 Tax=Nonomuraea rubra TaxID=46180 RepID=UPI0031EAD046
MLFDVTDAKVALSPDGTRAAVSRPAGRVELWNLAARRTRTGVVEVEPLTGADAAAPAVAFSPDGRMLAVAGRDGVTLVGAGGSRSRTGAEETFGAAVEPGPDTPADLAGSPAPAPTTAAQSPGVLALPHPRPDLGPVPRDYRLAGPRGGHAREHDRA